MQPRAVEVELGIFLLFPRPPPIASDLPNHREACEMKRELGQQEICIIVYVKEHASKGS